MFRADVPFGTRPRNDIASDTNMDQGNAVPPLAENGLKDRIRQIVKDHSGIRLANGDELRDSTDLYRAGMNSHASVILMIALENEFELEFPDGMLSRDVFESIDAIASAVESVQRVAQ